MFSPERPGDPSVTEYLTSASLKQKKKKKSGATVVASDCLLLCSARVITTWTPPPPPTLEHSRKYAYFTTWQNYDFDASKELLKFALRCGTLRCRPARGFLRLNLPESESCWMLHL